MKLGAGSYRLRFSYGYDEYESEVAEFVPQYFSGAADPGGATVVTVGSGATVPGIDAALAPAPIRVDKVSVSTAGGGAGSVTSSPAGIDCGTTCSSEFETRKTVTLNADPLAGSTFTGWTGACAGTGPCQIRLTDGGDIGPSDSSSSPPSTSPAPSAATETVTPKGGPSGGKPRPKRECKKGFKLKRFGKRERCVRVPKKHHPRKHHAKSATPRP
jgi:Divergent InlB B-repeat domain